ncbi:hypothetical protein ACFL1E_05225 [Candidatus Omnitrophota bacterium]
MKKKIRVIFLLCALGCMFCAVSFSQEQPMTQEEFAVELVRSMKLHDVLPLAALPQDCIKLLESLGIAPLKGWDAKAPLSEDDYMVVVAKSIGKEKMVHQKAIEVCDRIIYVVNGRWQKKPHMSLLELLSDRSIFPEGPPQCPYGLRFEDSDEDHRVDPHYHAAFLLK